MPAIPRHARAPACPWQTLRAGASPPTGPTFAITAPLLMPPACIASAPSACTSRHPAANPPPRPRARPSTRAGGPSRTWRQARRYMSAPARPPTITSCGCTVLLPIVPCVAFCAVGRCAAVRCGGGVRCGVVSLTSAKNGGKDVDSAAIPPRFRRVSAAFPPRLRHRPHVKHVTSHGSRGKLARDTLP